MNDRDAATLQWLIETAEDCPDGWDEDVFYRWVATKVSEANSISTSLTEDLAWDLAIGAVTRWSEPEFPQVYALKEHHQMNQLRLAAVLAKATDLNNSVWLTLAAYRFCSLVVPRLAEDGMPELIESLSSYSSRTSPLAAINDTLECLDTLIDSMDDFRRGQAAVIAISVVGAMQQTGSSYPVMRTPPGSVVAAPAVIANWVIARANEVFNSRTASDLVRSTARNGAYSSVRVEVLDAFRSGQLAASEVLSQFERRADSIVLNSPSVQGTIGLDLAILCADWLMESGIPGVALDHLFWADKRYGVGRQGQSPAKPLIQASAQAALGDFHAAVGELEPMISQLRLYEHRWWAGALWAYGRLMYETGDERGLRYLQRATDLAKRYSFWKVFVRMSLLLAEKEIEKGDALSALQRAQSISHVEDPRFSIHARVVLAEAHLALGRSGPGPESENLDNAHQILTELVEDEILDTPERILPRAIASLGELELVRGNYESACDYLREALSTLEQDPTIAWISPDDAPQKYWRRPWIRNWRRVAELALIAELAADEPNMSSAFTQLQRYRTLTHKGTIAELAGFTPELSLDSRYREALEKLRDQRRQLKAQEDNLLFEVRLADEAIGTTSTLTPGSMKVRKGREVIYKQLEEKRADLQRAEEDIRRVEQEAYETRGHIASAAEMRRPVMSEIKDHLTKANAAVVELVRLDGSELGLPIRWWAFVVTSEGIEDLVELPRREIDELLLSIRDDRTQINQWSLGKLSDLIIHRLPKLAGRFSQVFIAADGGAWGIPFRSLNRPRWSFVPWKLTRSEVYANWPVPELVKGWLDSLTVRMDTGVVSNVISTTHLVRLLERTHRELDHIGVVVGSSGGYKGRELCQGLAKTLELYPPAGPDEIRWWRYPGGLEEATPDNGDRPKWLEGESQVFLGSWHTEFTGAPTSVALFHFDDRKMSLAEFLSKSRHQSNIAVILSCNVSRTVRSESGAFSMMASTGFGIMEAVGTSAIVATTHQVTSEVAFVLGRLLTAELAKGCDVHTALAASQKRLREMTAAQVVMMVDPLKDDIPECEDLLGKMRHGDTERKAFPNDCDTEPFYILGLPTTKLSRE